MRISLPSPAAHAAPDRRPLPWVSWWYSVIFLVAIVALGATFLTQTLQAGESLDLRVIDTSGNPVAGARVQAGEVVKTTNDDGIVQLGALDAPQSLRVEGDGYQPVTGTIDPDQGDRQQVTLTPTGSSSLESPIAVGDVALAQGNQTDPANEADAITRLLQSDPAEDEDMAAGSSTPAAETGEATQEPEGAVEGQIIDAAGDGIQGARVTDGEAIDVTGEDGLFSIDRSELGGSAELAVFAPGYAQDAIELTGSNEPKQVTLALMPIKAIYMNPNITETQEDVDRLIELIDTTELNAIVIDIKEELIFYDTEVEFFQNAGTVNPKLDLTELLQTMEEHDIYTIARLVVFKDSLVAEQRPDLAVLNNQTGDLWRDMNGVAWVNPMMHELWEVNSDLAVEAATLGFDEIQYDYVRFPTDGDLSTMDFGLEYTQEIRERSITKFLDMSQEKLLPTGAKLSADVFGYTMLVEDDLGIGQNFAQLADYVDYLSPMIYPSHFPDYSMEIEGQPNDFPYETIYQSLSAGKEKLDGKALQMRPWLQDFDFFDMMPYGEEEVRAQIEATEEIGASGWMLWDPNNDYTEEALDPEQPTQDGTSGALPPAAPEATPAMGSKVTVRARNDRQLRTTSEGR